MRQREKRDSLAGGLGLLAAAAYLCWRGLKRVDARLRETKNKKP